MTNTDGQGKERGIMFYVDVMMRWKKFIVINVVVASLLAVGVSFILPKWYKATASILAPKDDGPLNLLAGTSSVLKGLTSMPKLAGFGKTPGAYNYFAILKSRSTMERVVEKFNLIEVYDIGDSMLEKAVRELRDNTAFEMQDDDYITIEVLDKDPQRAAGMANFIVQVLNETSIRLGTEEARNNRAFIEHRLESAKDSLRRAEEALKEYQKHSGMMITPEQSSSISALGELYAMKTKREIEAAVLEKSVTADNHELREIRIELAEIEKKLALIPQAALDAFRRYRDVAILQKILEVLVPMYEQAKIDEQKDVPVLLVLDKAIPPERKYLPKRMLIVFSVFCLTLFASVLAAFAMYGLMNREHGAGRLHATLKQNVAQLSAFYKIKADE